MIFEKLKQTLAAGQALKLGMAGDEFRIISAFWPCTVTLYKNNQVIGSASNWLSGDYVRKVEFDAVQITSSFAQEVEVFICSGGVGSDRITGQVEVIDGGKFRTIANNAFFGAIGGTAAAGKFPGIQIFNPSSNTKKIYLESFILSSPAQLQIYSGPCTADKATASSYTVNKNTGSADGSALMGTDLAMTGMPAEFKVGMAQTLGTGIPFIINFREPICINPGHGYLFYGTVAASSLTANVEFYEE